MRWPFKRLGTFWHLVTTRTKSHLIYDLIGSLKVIIVLYLQDLKVNGVISGSNPTL